jgi:hypothetical protein
MLGNHVLHKVTTPGEIANAVAEMANAGGANFKPKASTDVVAAAMPAK